jgi:predicted kinase
LDSFCDCGLLKCASCVKIQIMRKWMRERAKRRKPASENTAESTGKIGQTIDPSQPAPLMPTYDSGDIGTRNDNVEGGEAAEGDFPQQRPPERERRPRQEHASQGRGSRNQSARRNQESSPNEGKLEIETQPDSPSAPPEGAEGAMRKPPAGKKEPRGVVVLAIGLPGSGKTTWFKRRGVTPLSSDMLRSILFDSITEQRYQGLVFSTLRSLLRARLIAKMPWNYVDATNLSPHERRQWIKMARGFGFEVQAVFFDVPVELCIQRNSKRERQVPEDVMRQMASKLKPPTFKEGFTKIVVVRVKDSASSEV